MVVYAVAADASIIRIFLAGFIPGFILMALFSLDKLALFVVFLTPLAINLQHLEGGLGLSLPTEPIIFGIMLMFLFKQLHQVTIDPKVMHHSHSRKCFPKFANQFCMMVLHHTCLE